MKIRKNSKKWIIIGVLATAVLAGVIFLIVKKMTKSPDLKNIKPGESINLTEEQMKDMQKNAEKNHIKIEMQDDKK